MIQGYVRKVDRGISKAVVRTEYDDLIILRILDGSRVDVGDAIVGSLDSQGDNFIFDHSKRRGVHVYIENGRRLFTSPLGRVRRGLRRKIVNSVRRQEA
jgi:hypothetical protein